MNCESKVQLFYGSVFLPIKLTDDFKGDFPSVELAKVYTEQNLTGEYLKWAQIVTEDRIVASGEVESYDPVIWKWKEHEKPS
jgi:hypothetical protein